MKTRLQLLQTALGYIVILLGCSYSQQALADYSVGNITNVLQNIANNSIPGLTVLATSFSFVMGFWFMYRSLYELRKYGELRTMMRVDTNLMKPMLLFIVGVCLVYWPGAVATTMQTVFAVSSPLTYQQADITSSYQDIMSPIVRIVQFIGFIAFVRGMALLTTIADQGSASQGGLGKALSHIIGGILAVNVYGTWDVLSNTMMLSS